MRGPWKNPLVADGLLASGLAVIVTVTTATARLGDAQGHLIAWPALVCILVTCGLLTFRRRWPLPTLIGVFGATMGYAALGYPYGPIFLAVAVALGSYAARSPLPAAIAATAALTVLHVPYAVLSETDPDDPVFLNIAISVTWICASGLVGIVIKHAADTRDRAKLEERRRYLSEERLHLAREVHDVVGHSLAAISLHARVALHVLHRDGTSVPAEVVDSLTAIRDSGSAALDELRATLALAAPGSPATRPVLTLEDVESAVAVALSNDDLHIDVNVAGPRGEIPAVVDSAGYRIVQESLTNVVKHAGASRAAVDIGYTPGLVTVRVTDNGHGTGAATEHGHGLAGMAERATALGGSFAAGPRPDGGFTVTAELPYAMLASPDAGRRP